MSWALAAGAAGFGISTALGLSQAKRNRRFQRDFAKHGVEWRVADLKAAGLNPILAAGMGFGGGGQMGGSSAQIPDMGRIGEQVTASRGTDIKKKQLGYNERLVRAQDYLMTSQANTARLLGGKYRTETMMNEAMLPGLRVEALIDQGRYGKLLRYGQRALPFINTASGLIGARKLGRLTNPMGPKAPRSRPRPPSGGSGRGGKWNDLTPLEQRRFESRMQKDFRR